MEKIKFRGKDTLTGEMLFGDLLHAKRELLILPFGTKCAKTVDKDSVAQFIGYDCEGKEIYEDDKILSPNNLVSNVSDMLLNQSDLKEFKLYKNEERGENQNLS